METKTNTENLEEKYSKFTDDQIKDEFKKILSIPNARTDIDALTRLSALLPVMEERGLKQPSSQASHRSSSEPTSTVSWGGVILGVVLIGGGILMSMGTGRIYYGAVLLGIGILVKSFI